MAEFKKLGAVEAVETVSDAASVLIEENGVIKRAPKDEIGGGIKVASTAKVGQTIVVKAVDENGNPTEWECADKGDQADWNENDETSMAYIQNRPFYEYEGMNILFEETTIAFNSNGHAECSPQFWVDVGEEYIVTFDGVEYSCIGWKDSDECYNISFTVNGVKITIYDGYSIASSSAFAGNHTLKVEKKDILVQQLDNKFIPYILNSSTSGSTKRFKITVDDNGTLSAVEVTS